MNFSCSCPKSNPFARMKQLIRKCLVLFSSILLTISSPVFLLALSPLLMWRWALSVLVPKLSPTIKGILDPLGSTFASQGVYKCNLGVLVTVQTCDNILELTELQCSFEQNVLNLKHPNYTDGRPLFPQLRNKVSKWLGYYWWEEIPAFKVGDYVRYYEGRLASGEGKGAVRAAGSGDEDELVKEIIQEGLEAPFRQGTSPWEILVVNKKETNQMHIVHRLSHSIGDSSMFNILTSWGQTSPEREQPTVLTKPRHNPRRLACLSRLGRALCTPLAFLILGPFTLINEIILSHDSNAWTQANPKKWTGRSHVCRAEPMSFELLKGVRDKYHVRMLSLLLACYTQGLRKCMEEMKMKVPRRINCKVPIRLPHPEKGPRLEIGNFFTLIMVELPISEADSLKRLKLINEQLKSKFKFTIQISELLIRLASCLPSCFHFSWILKHPGPSTALTPLQAPSELITLCHQANVTEETVGVVMLPGFGPSFQTLTYNGKVRFSLAADHSVLPNPLTLQNMMEHVLKELEGLDQLRMRTEEEDELQPSSLLRLRGIP